MEGSGSFNGNIGYFPFQLVKGPNHPDWITWKAIREPYEITFLDAGNKASMSIKKIATWRTA